MSEPANAALLAATCIDPDDKLPRLVYHDWLEEQGHPEAAKWRVNVQADARDVSPSPLPAAVQPGWERVACYNWGGLPDTLAVQWRELRDYAWRLLLAYPVRRIVLTDLLGVITLRNVARDGGPDWEVARIAGRLWLPQITVLPPANNRRPGRVARGAHNWDGVLSAWDTEGVSEARAGVARHLAEQIHVLAMESVEPVFPDLRPAEVHNLWQRLLWDDCRAGIVCQERQPMGIWMREWERGAVVNVDPDAIMPIAEGLVLPTE